MNFLLGLSRLIDQLNTAIGKTVMWGVLLSVVISSVNAVIRYSLNNSSNAWLEAQWYLFSAVFLLCSGYTLLKNEHIRIDVVSGHLPRAVQIWIDILGTIFFLLPMAILIMWLSWPMVTDAFLSGEVSTNTGGLIRWPVRLLVPVGFFLLVLQGFSELIKKIAILTGDLEDPGPHGGHSKPAPLQPIQGETP
ncbi:MAG: TRAP transporter small permease subunit [Alphaproteobacteria bacterium]|nr:TRAP transporter small permease subunit [Alphaproteobacteria bacterium]